MASSSTTSPAEEAGNTIMSAHYLLSPLETLDESLNDSHEERIGLHDLTETYNLLATRIKEILLQSSEPDQAASPLTLLAERSHVLLSALRRDIKRVLINPRTTSPKERSQGMDLDEVHYARDLALLGQQAIRLTSELFAFPQLNATMHVNQLRLLLSDVLIILSETSLPTPHSKRTFALLRWILQVQKLPVNVLSPHNSKIIACVKRSLEGEKEHVNVDGLKILAELLRNYPKLFLGPACNLFSDALRFLISESESLRSAAAHTTSAFAYAKVLQGLPYSRTQQVSYELSRTIRKFSIRYLEEEEDPSLRNLLQSSLNNSHLSPHSAGPQWAAVVIASFIVLIDTPLFKSATLPQIKSLLWQITDHSSATVRLLHMPVWKCFVWAFARIPVDEENSKKVQTVISQDLRNGTGALLLHVMLNLKGKDMMARILEVVGWMFVDKPSRQDGVVVLCQLLGSARMPRSGTSVIPILHEQLFNGKILEAHLADLMKHTVTICDSTVVRKIIRELTVQETMDHWDKLYDLWKHSVKVILRRPLPDIRTSVIAAFENLLRADSEYCQRSSQVSPSSKVAHIVGNLCNDFPHTISDVNIEVEHIRVLRLLWHSVQRLFSRSQLLKKPGDKLLTAVVKRGYQISNVVIQAEWWKLCRDIVCSASGSEELAGGSIFDSRTWVAVARLWAAIDDVSADSLVTFLKFVFPEQLTADDALSLWGMLLHKALFEFRTRDRANDLWIIFAADDQTLALVFPQQFHTLISAFVIPWNTEQAKPVLRCWIEDQSTIVPDKVYFQSIFPLYEDILQRLRKEEPNERTLGLLWKLFLSPIERPVPSKEAVKAFEVFWFATYHGKDILFEPELIGYLKGLDMALGVGLAAGLTQSDDSQQTTGSLVPETQSLEPVPLTGSQILEKWFDTFTHADKANDPKIVPPSSSPIREPEISPPGGAAESSNLIPMLIDHEIPENQSNSASPRGFKRKRRQEDEEIVEETPAPISSVRISQREGAVPDIDELNNGSPDQRTKLKEKSKFKDKGKGRALSASEKQLKTPTKSGQKASETRSWIRESQLMTPEPSAPPSSHHGHAAAVSVSLDEDEGDEDYGSWENAVVSPETFLHISRELDVDIDAPDTNMVERDRFGANDHNDDDDAILLNSPSIRAAKRRKPSPKTTGTTNASDRARGRDRTISAKVFQLQQALQAFKDDTETPVEDLIKVSELVQEFGSKVNHKLLARTRTDRNKS
ncbi:hypothetical protein LENED_001656 [Lentinula edodes]|uniref:Telomere-associated protein Rif1 N-terminal domain-containing protein n=1 Tax=Lentinula edodes TaxID=5353 RepID=A0A1Q3DZ07_LENED|nr:hypothetical protein LENED_001656 [Lentinula edodes]